MFQHTRLNSDQNFFQKVKNLDFILIFCILILSILSLFVMYSTDGGEFLYHTKSHLIKLSVFFVLMLVISFFNIKIWHLTSYFLYIGIIFLWSKSIWISKMDRFIFFCATTFRVNENSSYTLSCKILSSNKYGKSKFI